MKPTAILTAALLCVLSPISFAKPVKVYILSGQSNMVGMGTLSGARNSYTGIYLSSDPEAPAGPLDIWQVGKFRTAPLAVFNSDGTPASDPIAQGSFEVPERGVYQVQCGSQPLFSSSPNRTLAPHAHQP